MTAAGIRKILYHSVLAAGMAFAALILLMFVFVFLIEQGWQRPFQSLHARGEMQGYLEETYAGQDLSVGFPVYNMVRDEFYFIVKDGDGQALLGLVYAEDSGITECAVIQGRDGDYYLSSE